ncbi:hypothetical protein [Kitasatospora sp. NPDC085879]|uniref:hypothetical protein n=1 Tax=Kitasatospora sp. NPDC085879 TaxID=3154769 RepID=UPI000BB13BBE|nr:hypothetical protein [Streptomyces sp. TLI_235]PBC78057.1 hypothetical protein BX265_2816 [Streptomyces sp. TLI_235]
MSTPVNLTHLAADLALDQNKVTPGLLGFVVFAALGIATWFLLKSMNSRFKKIDFVEEPETPKE